MTWNSGITVLKRVLARDGGQDLIEYALLMFLIAIAAVATVGTVGTTVKALLWDFIVREYV